MYAPRSDGGEWHRIPAVRAPQRTGALDEKIRREHEMAAMKPRTGDGPLEVTKEGRGIVMRVPLEGGGRLVVEMTPEEASDLGDALKAATG
ncbi:hypothetical protein PA7_24180 [Pseudonocardia asaccharolytica DSM 44247 = NBRC 16224]|uniref:DUF3117 domain-containing protein n=2 Tax=Pseudonocardia TaxID=1847 RepID=A0A511D1D6_9PSEU|nr:hypothetical protein PA7_24180 [Pseudonocardia asaccharolytica DSM 44247 = NBRC 16224]